jgi:hypothetical protein
MGFSSESGSCAENDVLILEDRQDVSLLVERKFSLMSDV